MISTINISLPKQLKLLAEKEIKKGYYASFSDLVRSSLRKTLMESELDQILEVTKNNYKKGKAIVLKTDKDVDNYFESL